MVPKQILDPLDANQMIPLVCAISRIENNERPNMFDVVAAWRIYMG
jgi:hypothetical protein